MFQVQQTVKHFIVFQDRFRPVFCANILGFFAHIMVAKVGLS